MKRYIVDISGTSSVLPRFGYKITSFIMDYVVFDTEYKQVATFKDGLLACCFKSVLEVQIGLSKNIRENQQKSKNLQYHSLNLY